MPAKDPAQAFNGFARPEQSWFRMPNNWTDITAGITSLAELKLVEYVLKHTWGYQEYEITKRITLDEFMSGRRRKDGSRIDRGTGLSKPSVISGLKSAVANGYLRVEVDSSDKARVKKYYRLRMAGEPTQTPEEAESPPPIAPGPVPEETAEETEPKEEGLRSFTPDVKNLYPDVKNVDSSGKESLQRSEKDNLERQQQTETTNNNKRTANADNDVVVALFNQGISRSVARRLARNFPAEYIALKQEYLDFLLANRPHEVKKPAAWLRKAIEDDYSAPDGFISSDRRELQLKEQNDRNQAVLAAQEADRARREAAEKEQAAAVAARRDRLRRQYGTTQEAVALWEQALEDLRFTAPNSVYAALVGAEVLQLDDDAGDESVLRVGLFHTFHWHQLQHPGYQTMVRRTLKQTARQPIEIDFVLLSDEALSSDDRLDAAAD